MANYAVDRTRWSKMSIFEQMGNIYSEVGRSFNAQRQGRLDSKDMAVSRAIDLFDATIDDLVKKKSVKAKEVLRAKEEYLRNVYNDKFNDKDATSLEKYFLEFAIAARKSR